MTIAISVRVGEGLVYAADSTSSFFETDGPTGRQFLAQSFHHAQKVMQLADLPVGIMTFGLGSIGARNLESMVAEFEAKILPTLIDEGGSYQVSDIATNLKTFLGDKYDGVWEPPQQLPLPAPSVVVGDGAETPEAEDAAPVIDNRPVMGVVIGGYSDAAFEPEEYLLLFPSRDQQETRPPGSSPFGVRWWGQTEPVSRLVLGVDLGLFDWMRENGVPEDALPDIANQLRSRFEWRIVFDGMPLQDAIDLVSYLANVTIGHSRFVVGPPVCGGHVDVATITHRGFNWIRQKELVVKSESVFF
jgi:hypothetical protein